MFALTGGKVYKNVHGGNGEGSVRAKVCRLKGGGFLDWHWESSRVHFGPEGE